MFFLEKKFRFETAHRLVKGYCGKCNNIHGHSWNGSVQVMVKRLDQYDMGVDYADLGKITKWLESEFDHKLILWEGDELVEKLEGKTALVITKDNPTSEVLAEFIFSLVKEKIQENNLPCLVSKIVIEETCTSRCEYIPNEYEEYRKTAEEK